MLGVAQCDRRRHDLAILRQRSPRSARADHRFAERGQWLAGGGVGSDVGRVRDRRNARLRAALVRNGQRLCGIRHERDGGKFINRDGGRRRSIQLRIMLHHRSYHRRADRRGEFAGRVLNVTARMGAAIAGNVGS